jgi:hypothetical protein
MTDALQNDSGSSEVAINLVRLCFASGREAEIALALTQYLGSREGSQIGELRPDIIMDDALDMAGADAWTSAEFCHMPVSVHLMTNLRK